jgi:hypothetical protein
LVSSRQCRIQISYGYFLLSCTSQWDIVSTGNHIIWIIGRNLFLIRRYDLTSITIILLILIWHIILLWVNEWWHTTNRLVILDLILKFLIVNNLWLLRIHRHKIIANLSIVLLKINSVKFAKLALIFLLCLSI